LIEKDVEYLQKEKLMDYSLLMAIRKISSDNKVDENLKNTIT
jgi:hypothetical protein